MEDWADIVPNEAAELRKLAERRDESAPEIEELTFESEVIEEEGAAP